MTDLTDPTAGIGEAWERGVADPHTKFLTVFARGIAARPDVYSDDLVNSARAVLATVEVPTPTLAEELRHIAEHWEEWQTATITSAIKAAADSAEQAEQERDEARAEVKRLAAVNENLRRTDNYREFKEFLGVQKGAESNAESIDPADVKPGEAWIVEVNGKRGTAMKDGDSLMPWGVVTDGTFSSRDAGEITLVSRLVPAPRVITNPDELDKLATRSVILSTDGQAYVYQKDSNGEWVDVASCGYPPRQVIRMENAVTVLWEPEA